MAELPVFAEFQADAGQNADAMQTSYRPVRGSYTIPCRISVRYRESIGRQGPKTTPLSWETRKGRGKAGYPRDRSHSVFLAGGELCLGLICAFVDGFLTADQIGPVLAWLRHHLPVSKQLGFLSYLFQHWPQPLVHWAPTTWIGVGVLTALIGRASLLPAIGLARLAGPSATKSLRILAGVSGLAGAASLVSVSGMSNASTACQALTSHQPILGTSTATQMGRRDTHDCR